MVKLNTEVWKFFKHLINRRKMKKILIIDAHPYHKGLASQLAREYFRGAQAGEHEVKIVEIRKLQFDPILRYGYRKVMELEPDLVEQQKNIMWCDHLVITTPIWWMSWPALFKGFIDRVMLPGFAYSYGDRKMIRKFIPKGLMKGKTVCVVYTQGSPRWITGLFLFDAHWLLMKVGVFKFIGFSSVRRLVFGNAEKLNSKQKNKKLQKVFELGKKGK